MVNIISWIQVHAVSVIAGIVGLGGGALGHAFGPAIYKAAGNWITKEVTALSGEAFHKLINPNVADPLDRADVIVIAQAAIRMAERHMDSADGQKKMGWVLDMLCAKTGIDRGQAGIIAQQAYTAWKAQADAAAAASMPILPVPKPPVV